MNIRSNFLTAFFVCTAMVAWSQEKGSFKNNPKIKIKDNTGLYKEKEKKQDDLLDEMPKLQFRNEFEVVEKQATPRQEVKNLNL
jgi:hypothetical protein